MPAREFEDELPDYEDQDAPVEPPKAEKFAASVDQQAVASRLQAFWLQRMEFLMTSGMATSTDLATLARVLLANGWSLDPKKLPQGLQSLVSKTEFTPEGGIRLVKAG